MVPEREEVNRGRRRMEIDTHDGELERSERREKTRKRKERCGVKKKPLVWV